jgi:formate dehydrogenase iron-sulfur subunit
MTTYGMLIDETRCTGCRACQVACKQWNDLEGEKTTNTGSYQNPPHLSASTWNLIEFHESESGPNVGFYFVKKACMHCQHPACASVCPVGALKKTEMGPVIYDDAKCIGCRYCMAACPFGVPTFQWDTGLRGSPVIRKCSFCVDRLSNGLTPSCAKACPSMVITFGERDKLLAEAQARIASQPGRYVNHVYGATEAGGTSILYLAAVPFASLGFPTLGSQPVTRLSENVMSKTVPFALGWTAMLAGIYGIVRLRERGKLKPVAQPESHEEAPQ